MLRSGASRPERQLTITPFRAIYLVLLVHVCLQMTSVSGSCQPLAWTNVRLGEVVVFEDVANTTIIEMGPLCCPSAKFILRTCGNRDWARHFYFDGSALKFVDDYDVDPGILPQNLLDCVFECRLTESTLIGTTSRTAIASANIIIKDRNDNAPEAAEGFPSGFPVMKPEVWSHVLTVKGTDKDQNQISNGRITYHLASGTDNTYTYFDIGETTGRVIVKQNLDWSLYEVRQLIVELRDHPMDGTPSLTTSLTLSLQMKDFPIPTPYYPTAGTVTATGITVTGKTTGNTQAITTDSGTPDSGKQKEDIVTSEEAEECTLDILCQPILVAGMMGGVLFIVAICCAIVGCCIYGDMQDDKVYSQPVTEGDVEKSETTIKKVKFGKQASRTPKPPDYTPSQSRISNDLRNVGNWD